MEAMRKSFTRTGLLVWTFVLGVCSLASAQELQPFGPVSIEHYHDLQLFAPADLGDFGNQPDPHYGFFGSYERVNWHIGKPKGALIGSADAEGLYRTDGNLITEDNSVSTNLLNASTGWGNRFDLGYMQDNNNGWLVSVTSNVGNGQQFNMDNALVLFDDPNSFLSPVFVDRDGDGFDDDLNHNLVYGQDGEDTGTFYEDPINEVIPGTPQVITNGAPGVIEAGAITVAPGGTVGDVTAEAGVVVVTPAAGAVVTATGINRHYDLPLDGIPDTPTAFDLGDSMTVLTRFDTLAVSNKSSYNTVELMKMYRFDRDQFGGIFELYGGARYTQFDDQFRLDMGGGYFDGSFVNNQVLNNMVGPQIGGRYAHQKGRWNVSVEGRYFAAANIQNTTQSSGIASAANQYPDATTNGVQQPTLAPNYSLFGNGLYGKSAADSDLSRQFSNVGELRLNTTYSLSKSVALKVGYTMTYMDNIARASNTITYALPNFGINRDQPGERLFVQGVNFGVELNR
jgi:hypothetical protein